MAHQSTALTRPLVSARSASADGSARLRRDGPTVVIAVLGRRRLTATCLFALAVVLLALPSVAGAARKPTKRERAHIAQAVGAPSKCLDITVSKVVSVRVRGKLRRYR